MIPRRKARLLVTLRLLTMEGGLTATVCAVAVANVLLLRIWWALLTPVAQAAYAIGAVGCAVVAVGLVHQTYVTFRAWRDTFDDVVLMDRWDRYVTRTPGL
jgi:hypothetical protein